MTTMIGDNLHAQKLSLVDMVATLNIIKQNQPTLQVVMDSFEFAKQIQDASPNTIVIHRDYMGVGGDDNLCQKMTPEDWLTLQRNKGDFRIYRYTCNESGWNDTVIQWHIKLLKVNATNPLPLKLCILNLGIGQPRPEEWALGKELLQLASQYKAWCLIGLHEYAGGIITSGFIGGNPDGTVTENGNMVKRDGLTDYTKVENWPTPAQAKDMTMWHMGRFKFLNLYCTSQNIPLPRIAITEWGFDHLGDIDAWLKTLQQTAPYTSIRGWKSLKEQWAKWFASRGWSHERAYIEQLQYAFRAIYENTNVIGMAIFCAYLTNIDWEQFDISKADEFQKWRTAYATLPTIPPVTPPVDPPKPPVKTVEIPLEVLAIIRSELQGDIDINSRYIVQLTAITKDKQSTLELVDELIRKAVSS
jgi:hypothetical protein